MALNLSSKLVGKKEKVEACVAKGVRDITEEIFKNNDILRYVSLPETVTTIYEKAFSGCSSLEKIVMPKTMEYIGANSFEDCSSLKEIELPVGLTVIKKNTFRLCKSLKYIRIPEGVKKIEYGAFFNCPSLKVVELPSTLEEIESFAFYNCTELEKVNGGSSLIKIGYSAFSRCFKLEDVTLNSSVCHLSEQTFDYGDFEVPDYILTARNVDKLTTINEENNEKVAVVSDSVVTINDNAFSTEKLDRVILPDTVKNISYNAFFDGEWWTIFEKKPEAQLRIEALPKAMNMPKDYFKQKTQFDEKMAFFLVSTIWNDYVTDEDFECMVLYQNRMSAQFGAYDYLYDNCEEHLMKMLDITDNTPLQLEHIAGYAVNYMDSISPVAMSALKNRCDKYNAYNALVILDKFYYSVTSADMDETTKYCLDYFNPYYVERSFIGDTSLKSLINRICYIDGDRYVPEYVVKSVLDAYMSQSPINAEETEIFDGFACDYEADYIADRFEKDRFLRLIDALPLGDPRMLGPVCRYGDLEIVQKVCTMLTEGDDNDLDFDLWKSIAKKALSLCEIDEIQAFLDGFVYADEYDEEEDMPFSFDEDEEEDDEFDFETDFLYEKIMS